MLWRRRIQWALKVHIMSVSKKTARVMSIFSLWTSSQRMSCDKSEDLAREGVHSFSASNTSLDETRDLDGR